MKRCKVCGTDELRLQFRGEECHHPKAPPCPDVYRCLFCGSDSLDNSYEQVRAVYSESYLRHNLEDLGGYEACMEALRSNVEWFRDYKPRSPGQDFIDIGFLEGAALTAMQNDGWRVHGFEVIPQAYLGAHTTISTTGFNAGLFPQRYHAALAREVIEHVPDWRQFLAEVHAVLVRGGLFQLQTPRPWHEPLWIPYQQAHLQILSPGMVRYWAERVGFSVLDFRLWDAGQCWMLQRV